MSDAIKVGFVPLSSAARGILVVFCDDTLKLGPATAKALGGATELVKRAASAAGLTRVGLDRFGADYARTLAEWTRRFDAAWPEIEAQGFDERFRRLWRFYLAYCEAGFRTGRTEVIQVILAA